MFLQVPTPTPGQIENWLIPAAAVASMALLFKKLFPRRKEPGSVSAGGSLPPDLITRSELHHELSSVRDKIDSRFLGLTEKIEHLRTTLNDKLTTIDSAVARLDERTKK